LLASENALLQGEQAYQRQCCERIVNTLYKSTRLLLCVLEGTP